MKIFTAALGILLALAFALPAFAANKTAKISRPVDLQSECAELVEECFGYKENERANCFYSAATHPFCEGTDLGKLTYKRWSMSPVKLPGQVDAPAFLGPQLIDGSCIANFDNQWFGKIVDNKVSKEDITSLQSSLDNCRKESPAELPRP